MGGCISKKKDLLQVPKNNLVAPSTPPSSRASSSFERKETVCTNGRPTLCDGDRPKKCIMLSSKEHMSLLNDVSDVRKMSAVVMTPYLQETTERKYREYIDLLENPTTSNVVPHERFISFWKYLLVVYIYIRHIHNFYNKPVCNCNQRANQGKYIPR